MHSTGDAIDYAGQSDRAIEEYNMNLKINPNYFLTHFHLEMYYYAKCMFKEAVVEYKKAVDLSHGNPYAISCLISGYYKIGKRDQADKLFKNLKKRSETEYVPATSFYLIHRVRGEEDLAFKWLKRACNEHDTFLPKVQN